jgi:hypothetical protein
MLFEPVILPLVERWASTLGSAITIRNTTWDSVATPMVIESLFLVIPTRRIGDSKTDWKYKRQPRHDVVSVTSPQQPRNVEIQSKAIIMPNNELESSNR